MTLSTNFGWDIPDVGADSDTWGALLNAIIAYLDQMQAGQALGDEATVASAATADIGAANRNRVQITGTTTITSFGTTANCFKVVRFAGALTLTHNGTSLILPGAANRTTAAGDVGIYMSDASGNWREISYATASGPNGLVKLATLTANNSATLEDTTSLLKGYSKYVIQFKDIVPGTTGTGLRYRASTNGGVSYDNASVYAVMSAYAVAAGTGGFNGTTYTSGTLSVSNIRTTGVFSYNATFILHNFTGAQTSKHITGQAAFVESAGSDRIVENTGGAYNNATAVNALQFFMTSGVIASGTIEIYGVK